MAPRLPYCLRCAHQQLVNSARLISVAFCLTGPVTRIKILAVPSALRVLFARHRMGRAGCGVLRCCLASSTREASGKTALPPLRAERANAPMRDRGHRSRATPEGFAKAGPEPTTAAVERREASVADATQGARWRLRAYVTGPPTGAAAPERLSALRSPRFCDGGLANLGGHFASRER